jgi:chromosome segregation ATPase
MTRSMSKSIFVRREWDVWAMLQHHQVALLRSNEQLAQRSAEVAYLTSRCEGLKEEGATDREKVRRLRDEVRSLKAEANHREEELRQLKESLQAVTVERDDASLRADSLSKFLAYVPRSASVRNNVPELTYGGSSCEV